MRPALGKSHSTAGVIWGRPPSTRSIRVQRGPPMAQMLLKCPIESN